MRVLGLAIATYLAVLGAAIEPAAAQLPLPATPPTAIEAEDLGRRAYEFGFPLMEFLRTRSEMTSVACPDRKGDSPVNSFSNADRFADPSVRSVVAPNTDTLYSIAHLDLSKGPLTLSHPAMGKRYWSFALLDPYTNMFAIGGSRRDGGRRGTYVVRWRGGPTKRRIRPSGGGRVLNSRYRRVWVIGRTLATDSADQRAAFQLMQRYKIKLPNGKQRRFPPDCEPGEPIKRPTPTDGAEFIAALDEAMAENPPRKRDQPLLQQLARVGVGPGLSPETAGLTPDALASLYAGVKIEAETLPTDVKVTALRESQKDDGWYLPPADIGRYGTDYPLRELIASAGLGANTQAEAMYPTGVADSNGVLFNGSNRYRLTFAPGELPPAKYFWSLTMYDGDGYLVDNAIDRYSVGPSHPPLLREPDGSVVISIQQQEPAEAEVNWLPAPSGQFRLSLRLYGPTEEALNRTWKPPPVFRVVP